MPLEKQIVSKRHLRRKIESKLKSVLTSCNTLENENTSLIPTQLNSKNDEPLFQSVVQMDSMCKSDYLNFELLSDNEINYKNTLDYSIRNRNKLNFDNSLRNRDNVFIVNEDNILTTSTTDFNIERHFSCRNTVDAEYTSVHGSNENNYFDKNEIKCTTFNANNLRNRALKNNIKHTALDELLQMLKGTYNYLPHTARSLLNTPKQTKIFPLNNGDMCYFGIEIKLKQKLKCGLKKNVNK